MRTSAYTVFIALPDSEHHYLIHGYSGAVDRATSEVLKFLLFHRDKDATGKTQDVSLAVNALGYDENPPSLSSETQALLFRRGYLTNKSPSEERAFVHRMLEYSYNRRAAQARPSFMIVPSHDCNVRCWYCYEARARTALGPDRATVMSRDMADAAFICMDALVKDSNATVRPQPAPRGPIQLALYGGEPLREATVAIVQYIIEQARAREFRTFAITNGIELQRFASILGPDGLERVQLTLDGPREQHDRIRRGPAHKHTYDVILDNMILALDRGVEVMLRIHLDRTSLPQIGEIIKDLDEKGARQYPALHVYTVGRHLWDRGNAFPVYPEMSPGDIDKDITKYLPDSERPPYMRARGRLVSDKLRTYINVGVQGLLADVLGCSASTSLYMFDPFGAVYPCFDVCGDPREQIGTYSRDGIVLNERCSAWWGRSLAALPECVDCKYVLFDKGGCPAASAKLGGSPLSSYCGSYEASFLSIARDLCSQGRIEEIFASSDDHRSPEPCGV